MNKALAMAGVLLAMTFVQAGRTDAAPACSQISAPVCAVTKNGVRQTYANASCAAAEGATVLHKDGCSWVACVPGHTVCAIDPATKKPATYNSLCSAEYYHAAVVGDGKCKGKG